MTDELEQGPDPNEVRRHAKRMLTELEYRKRYRRIDYYKPNPKQLEFHNLIETEVMLRAANQVGKTTAVCAQLTFDALGSYPGWYQGRRFDVPPPIERPHEFVGWAGCTTSVTTRDGVQTKLLGDVRQQDGLGTGLIPLDHIVGTTMARGISDFVDTMTLRRENGKSAIIRLKTFEQDRTAWQGEAVDEIVLDEDSGDDVIYGEALARLAATSGRILVSMTPVLGRTPIRKRFIERLGHGCAEIVMGLQDADHIPKEQHAEILARYKASERATRAYGSDMQGEGAVFEIPESEIVHTRDPAQVPSYWRWLWGLDFSHGGMSAQAHPFAAVLGVHDIDSDCIYIMHALRMRQALPIQHVHALKQHPAWEAPCAWPHDGQMTGFGNTVTFSQTYRNLGLHMRPTFATFKDGGFSLENGIAEMEQRFATGRLKVAAHLGEWLDEFRNYHRDGGLVVKADDDLLSATRQLVMDIRYAKSLTQDRHGDFRRQERRELYASGIDFPLT